MPALRKSARNSLHRSSSTPYASPTGTPGDSHGGGKRQSLMTDHWSEPVPQTLASFEEHGFVRQGVLETMAPLGVPPSARVKQRTRAMGETVTRTSTIGKGNPALGDEFGSTPEVTPAPELDPDDSERPDEEEMQIQVPVHEEEEDDDYEPTKTKKKGKISKTPVRGKTPVQSKTPVQGKTPLKNGTVKSTAVSASPAVQPIQSATPADADMQRIHTAVNDAIIRANRANNRQISVALKEMWEDAKTDPTLLPVMDAIIHRNSSDEQWEVFRAYIKKSRKRQRKDAKNKRLQDEPSNHGQSSDLFGAVNSSRPSSPRASSEVAPDDSVSAVHETAYQGHTKESKAFTEDIQQGSGSPVPHPLSNAPNIPADTSAEPPSRMPSKSPRKKHATNGHIASGSTKGTDTPAGKTPETVGGSDSELSEVNEDIVQKGPPEPVQANGKAMTPAAIAAAKKVKSAAMARAAKKAKPNAGKLFGKHAQKQQHQPTPEQLAEEQETLKIRDDFAKKQPIRALDQNFPVSDVRFDDEINDTESLTESQIAVGPPVDSYQPRRAGRVPQQGSKRLRENASDFSSPRPESAATTRPSTPAVGPASKRIKLSHGQAARTKRSPVKNRQGGPIAGVAFNGGGGSRQLGPDDNRPNSPQSESDDLCSACRGTGEFVCCEGCPRVFHLLCCDPPRLDVPEGSFYCYECTARLGLSDEIPVESHSSLGPLFKSLERINPRAFSLPKETQTAFEGVSARADGSYFEEVKKFPLAKHSGYGYQAPDYTKILDSDDKAVLCAQCGATSGHKRQLLKCDFCHAYWHLDCLDPPLANPPNINLEASQRDAWRCPRHVEHDLRSGLLLQHDLNDAYENVEMADAAPALRVPRKVRKPKNPQVIEPTFTRGMRNNGLIDIINDTDDDTDGEGNYVFGQDESKDLNSKIFRVPERGVILDFISKVKSGRVTKKAEKRAVARTSPPAAPAMQNFLARSVEQQQAALNLARLANQDTESTLAGSSIEALILQLTSEAPSSVVTAMDNVPPPPVSQGERGQLMQLLQLIMRRLNVERSDLEPK